MKNPLLLVVFLALLLNNSSANDKFESEINTFWKAANVNSTFIPNTVTQFAFNQTLKQRQLFLAAPNVFNKVIIIANLYGSINNIINGIDAGIDTRMFVYVLTMAWCRGNNIQAANILSFFETLQHIP